MPPPRPAPAPVYRRTRAKRGEGGAPDSTLTYYPTTPPASTMRHGGHIPKIAGSEGGFLGLVIGLGVLFIACAIAVWFLLKRRREQGRRALPIFSTLVRKKGKNQPSERSIPTTGGVFGRLGGKDRRGWVRTNDTDGQDDSDDEGQGHSSSTGVKLTETRSRSPNPPSAANANREREGLYSNDSNPFASASTTRFQETPGPYGDAFSARPSTDSLDEAVHGRYAPTSTSHGTHETSPTFESGTRFKETF